MNNYILKLANEIVKMQESKPDEFVFRDSGFTTRQLSYKRCVLDKRHKSTYDEYREDDTVLRASEAKQLNQWGG